jgi:GFO/IDH/MocA oxidoreductase family protein
MAERPAYAIVGGGYWAGRMRAILAEGHRVISMEHPRQGAEESAANYGARLAQLFRASGAQAAWICVPPGPHVALMAEAALEAGLHAIAEKPWLSSKNESQRLRELAARKMLILGVHYQYCLLEAVEAWRCEMDEGAGLEFGGSFTISRADRLGLDAMDNLGSHLVAIGKYAAPKARMLRVTCGYQMAEERKVWVEKDGGRVATIDFTGNREPIIQRFVGRLEKAMEGAAFPFGLEFAERVADGVAALKQKARG